MCPSRVKFFEEGIFEVRLGKLLGIRKGNRVGS